MFEFDAPIGVMDSGVGGMSVLNALRFVLPNENCIYMGDSLYAPYGKRRSDELCGIVTDNVDMLIRMGCKAVVIACNTATAVAVENVRNRYPAVPIVGLEPAVRPALAYARQQGGAVLALATDITVREERFHLLCKQRFAELETDVSDGRDFFPKLYALSLQKTVEYVEKGEVESEQHIAYLSERMRGLGGVRFSAVVEGCTHFPFAEKAITKALGYRPCFFDGAMGAARRMCYLLEKYKLRRLESKNGCGWVEWVDTLGECGYAKRFRALRGEGIGEEK